MQSLFSNFAPRLTVQLLDQTANIPEGPDQNSSRSLNPVQQQQIILYCPFTLSAELTQPFKWLSGDGCPLQTGLRAASPAGFSLSLKQERCNQPSDHGVNTSSWFMQPQTGDHQHREVWTSRFQTPGSEQSWWSLHSLKSHPELWTCLETHQLSPQWGLVPCQTMAKTTAQVPGCALGTRLWHNNHQWLRPQSEHTSLTWQQS